jgi:predicted nucleic acid-binding protein
MKRIILDTNIYGFILQNDEPEKIEKLIFKSDIAIYGVRIIRKELRDTPKKSDVYDRSRKTVRNLRGSLLTLYSNITKKEYDVSERTKLIAGDYYIAYKGFGGKDEWKDMENDFFIVACASIHNLDIVVSEDNKTMLSDEAINAYKLVNKMRKYKMPQFINYAEFRRLLP